MKMTVKKNPMGRLRYSWGGKITFINSKIGKLEGCATIWFLIMKDYEGKEMSGSTQYYVFMEDCLRESSNRIRKTLLPRRLGRTN